MKRIIYLDNSATTKPCKRAIDAINKALCENWGNPSSLHTMGINAEISVTDVRELVAKKIGAAPNEIVFTGSGTEGNNTALLSALARKKRGNKVITTKIEHPSVLETVERLEREGFEVLKLDSNSEGQVDLEELASALDEKTVLVSVMLVNNEIGSIEPITEISKLIEKSAPNAFFHCDAVQAFGKLPIDVKKLGVDLLTASAHKVHGPKGIGFLYVRKGLNLPPLLTGGGQERGLRSGTESVPLIRGLGGAVEELGDVKSNLEKMQELNLYTRKILSESGIAEINSPKTALPYILNISVLGYRSETLLHFLDSKGIFVSSGSACAKGELSYVLSSLGLDKAHIDSALRISFSKDNTKEDVDLLLEALKEAATKLRRFKI